jgi:hypothetical protein
MDEFGVLTERFGLKPQGKSAPMASTKRSSTPKTVGSPQNGSRSPQHSTFDFDYGVFATANNKTQTSGDFSDGIDQIFGAGTGIPKSNLSDPIFGGGFNQSVSTSKSSHVYVDDIFGGVNEKTVGDGIDDLLGKIGGLHATNGKSSMQKSPDFDDLMAGFGGNSSVSNNGYVWIFVFSFCFSFLLFMLRIDDAADNLF